MQVSISLGIAHKNLSNTVLSHTFDSVASRALIYIKAMAASKIVVSMGWAPE